MQVSCLACCSDIKTVSVIPGKRLKTTKRGNLTIAIRQIEAFALPFEGRIVINLCLGVKIT